MVAVNTFTHLYSPKLSSNVVSSETIPKMLLAVR